MKKDGYFMNSIKTNNQKKISGAIISTILFNLLFIFMMILITYFEITEEDKIPLILFKLLNFFEFLEACTILPLRAPTACAIY